MSDTPTAPSATPEPKPHLARYAVIFAAISLIFGAVSTAILIRNTLIARSGPQLRTTAVAHANMLPPSLTKDAKPFQNLGGLWKVDIINQGDAPAENVALHLWDSGRAVVVANDLTIEEKEFKNVIRLGTIEVGSGVSVNAWVEDEPKIDKAYIAHDGTPIARLRMTTDWNDRSSLPFYGVVACFVILVIYSVVIVNRMTLRAEYMAALVTGDSAKAAQLAARLPKRKKPQ